MQGRHNPQRLPNELSFSVHPRCQHHNIVKLLLSTITPNTAQLPPTLDDDPGWRLAPFIVRSFASPPRQLQMCERDIGNSQYMEGAPRQHSFPMTPKARHIEDHKAIQMGVTSNRALVA
ncbi:uncharacterized protein SPSK_08138 [Sporothrix schenckii 1099-18]|uniref:Uncharacterized protein n=1 Tax=Sporothrix schenckii 1099-18 TaxID=1397361 RepID=A0A0F2MFQ1_SPOSC|nr:uncharacterized protein SPSK_08138 [Sporothrix schenckii 1099-18]KJR88442.1 hypothetical protein SPSK_08138 [Sporothrix schenckii 1099-18]